MSKPTRRRVYLFITRLQRQKGQVLVFTHESPNIWSGVQTPGGTIEPEESPLEAAIREAYEETGLTDLGEPRYLVGDTYEGSNENLIRHFFQVPVTAETPDCWTHRVLGAGVDMGMEFHCRWVDLPDAGDLDEHFKAHLDLVVI